MATQPESRLQRKIQKGLGIQFPGSFWFKHHGGPYSQAGIPDLIGCVKGLYFGLEVKMPGKKPTDIQAETIDEILEAGGAATYVTSLEEAINFVRTTLDMASARSRRGRRT